MEDITLLAFTMWTGTARSLYQNNIRTASQLLGKTNLELGSMYGVGKVRFEQFMKLIDDVVKVVHVVETGEVDIADLNEYAEYWKGGKALCTWDHS